MLLAFCDVTHRHHKPAWQWANSLVEPGAARICRSTQLSLLRLLNNRAVMGAAVFDTDGAWRLYDALLADERFIYHQEPNLDAVLRDFTKGRNDAPKLWADAYLAAFAYAAGLTLVSFDAGFRQFPIDCLILTD